MAMPILQQIIGTITGKVAFERTQANFNTIKDTHNALETVVGTKAPNADLVAHKAESANKHITETGTNANGKYIKFDDGTMICTIKKEATYNEPSRLYLWLVFPVTFVEPPVTIVSGNAPPDVNYVGGMINIKNVMAGTIANNNGDFWVNSISSNLVAGNKVMLNIILMGRWK